MHLEELEIRRLPSQLVMSPPDAIMRQNMLDYLNDRTDYAFLAGAGVDTSGWNRTLLIRITTLPSDEARSQMRVNMRGHSQNTSAYFDLGRAGAFLTLARMNFEAFNATDPADIVARTRLANNFAANVHDATIWIRSARTKIYSALNDCSQNETVLGYYE